MLIKSSSKPVIDKRDHRGISPFSSQSLLATEPKSCIHLGSRVHTRKTGIQIRLQSRHRAARVVIYCSNVLDKTIQLTVLQLLDYQGRRPLVSLELQAQRRLAHSYLHPPSSQMPSGDRGATSTANPEPKKGVLSKLSPPAWLTDSFKHPRTWKNFTRCMVTTFASMVLMLAQPCTPISPSSTPKPLPCTVQADADFSAQRDWISSLLRTSRLDYATTLHGFEHLSIRLGHAGDGDVDRMGVGMRCHGCGIEGEESSVAG